MHGPQYHELAMRTAAGPDVLHVPSNPQELDALNREAVATLLLYAMAARQLDRLKSILFYGKTKGGVDMSDLAKDLFGSDRQLENADFCIHHIPNPQFIHAVLGIASEGGELVEDMLVLMTKPPVDKALDILDNVVRESGDVDWFQELLATSVGITVDEGRERNIARLSKRFPDKFTAAAAIARADEDPVADYYLQKNEVEPMARAMADETHGDGA